MQTKSMFPKTKASPATAEDEKKRPAFALPNDETASLLPPAKVKVMQSYVAERFVVPAKKTSVPAKKTSCSAKKPLPPPDKDEHDDAQPGSSASP